MPRTAPVDDSSAASAEALPEEAERQLAEARQRLKQEPHSAYAASQVLRWMRKVQTSPLGLLSEARAIRDQFPDDPWVASNLGWLLYDACKLRVRQEEAVNCVPLLDEMVALFPKLGSRSTPFLQQTARVFDSVVKATKERPGQHQQTFQRLLSVGRTLQDAVLPVLSTDRALNPQGREIPSHCEQFLLRLRTVAEAAADWEFLKTLSLDVIQDRWPVADRKWFAKSLLDALRHSASDDAAAEAAEEFLRLHGDDEHLQLARANFLISKGDREGARAAFTASVALGHTPWSWREFAKFVGRSGDPALARTHFRAALSWLDRSEPGPTWEVHLELAQVARWFGDWHEAAAEVRLARWSREIPGWRPDSKVDGFVSRHRAELAEHLAVTESVPAEELLKQRLQVYRAARDTALDTLAALHTVARASPERGLAWVVPVDGPDQDEALLRTRSPRQEVPPVGSQVRAITVPSWDSRRNRPSRRTAWWRV